MKKYNVAIVGATGLVGSTFLKVLAEYNFPVKNLRLLASIKSVGKIINYAGRDYVVECLDDMSFDGMDIALFSAGASVSKQYAPIAAAKGCLVIDNSSAWRMDPIVPLVVPEVNMEDIKKTGIIANPNCSTIQCMLPLKALDNVYGLERVVYTTFQSVAGSGMKGILDLDATRRGESPSFYPYSISDTCIPEIDILMPDGYTKEEMKMIDESRKILHHPDLKISATCVRVPIRLSHAVSIQVELKNDFDISNVRKILAEFKNIVVVDDMSKHLYPVSTMSNGNDKVYVGRIRKDLSAPKSLLLYCVADNIRKGAASNAVQIAQEIIAKGII